MHIRSTIITASLTLLLSACGGKSLSFKNSDEVIKSYKSVTANLTEAERLEFRRNMFLVAWTDEAAEAKLSISDVHNAWSLERNTLDLTGPNASPLAKELALKGVSRLDGKTVAQVNKLGDVLTSKVVDIEVKSVESKITSMDAAIKQLTEDKQSWQALNTEAAAAEAALFETTKKYSPKVTGTEIGKSWQGILFKGQVSMSSPYEDPIFDFRNNYTIEHNGHFLHHRKVGGQFTAYKKTSPFSLILSPQYFINAQGDSLPKDYDLPKDISAYDFKFRPVWVRTSGKKEGWKQHEYELDKNHSTALYNLPKTLKGCDHGIETAQKFRTNYETQIETLKAKKFDELKNIYGRFTESCF